MKKKLIANQSVTELNCSHCYWWLQIGIKYYIRPKVVKKADSKHICSLIHSKKFHIDCYVLVCWSSKINDTWIKIVSHTTTHQNECYDSAGFIFSTWSPAAGKYWVSLYYVRCRSHNYVIMNLSSWNGIYRAFSVHSITLVVTSIILLLNNHN